MVYILAPERDEDPTGAFERYADYLRCASARFPPGALGLATSDWYFDSSDHRAPHDAWLQSASFIEQGGGERAASRTVALQLRLLGAYHDLELEFYYARVFAYEFRGSSIEMGHGDWRYDEFRVDDQGRLIHEIQWCGQNERTSWLICAEDVAFTTRQVG